MKRQVLLSLLVLLTSFSLSEAKTIEVPTDFPTIQQAIDAAADYDVIVIGIGTFYGEGNFNLDFKGKAITVRGKFGKDSTTIDCNNNGRGFYFHSGEDNDSVVEGLTIKNGAATFGGAIECEYSSPTISNCLITINEAFFYGGGIDLYYSNAVVRDCIITGNEAMIGGGINCDGQYDDGASINSCHIYNNQSTNVGGAISCYEANPKIHNCLININESLDIGAAIYLWDAQPQISNCTITNNTALADFGGIYNDSLDKYPNIISSILWNNGDELFQCSAIFSCIEDNDPGKGNIHQDPQFIGPYYLSNEDAGQLSTSPCVDAGGNTAINTGLYLYTTRSDNVPDSGVVDMGYHHKPGDVPVYLLKINPTDNGTTTPDPGIYVYNQYTMIPITAIPDDGFRVEEWLYNDEPVPANTGDPNGYIVTLTEDVNLTINFEPIPQWELTLTVTGPGGQMTTPPRSGIYGPYYDGTKVQLIASPSPGYVTVWEGTDNDYSIDPNNSVTMDSEKAVTVSFRKPVDRFVPSQYHSIGAAMGAALGGDRVVVSAQVYGESGLDFEGKAITVTSENPDDPACVAATIINCGFVGRAFVLQNGEGHRSVIDGFTIINGSPVVNPKQRPGTANPGIHGADAYGGAVACFNGSSVTIANCIIRNCRAQGRDGGHGGDGGNGGDGPDGGPGLPGSDGAPGEDAPDPGDPEIPGDGLPGEPGMPGEDGADGGDGGNAGDGGRGGDGGDGLGGAFYFDEGSDPIIMNCVIENCWAIGGDAGYGGNGGQGGDGGDGGDGGNGGNGGDGGAGINGGDQGVGGAGGNGGNGSNGGLGGDGGRGGDGGFGGIAIGGTMYFHPNCQPVIKNCEIIDCNTIQGLGNIAGNGGDGGNAGSGGAPGEGGTAGAGGAAGAPNPGNNRGFFAPDANDPNYTDVGLTAGVTYYYRCRSIDSQNNLTAWSEIAFAAAEVGGATGPADPVGWDMPPEGSADGEVSMRAEINPDSEARYEFEWVPSWGVDGFPGMAGTGGSGGRGGDGGDGGHNGFQSWAGAVFYDSNSVVTISETIISGNAATTDVNSFPYNAGNGGNGGNGGANGAGAGGGRGGDGGNGGIGGNAGDAKVIGAGGDGGNGGNGGGAGPGGNGGDAGNGGPAGIVGIGGTANGLPGNAGINLGPDRMTTSYGGADYYGPNSTASFTNCTIDDNRTYDDDGGGLFFDYGCNITFNNCNITNNLADYHGSIIDPDYGDTGLGGGSCFGSQCSIEVNDCNFINNYATLDGGGIFCWFEDSLNIKNSNFSNNSANGYYGSGGGVYGGGVTVTVWHPEINDWLLELYNNSTISVENCNFNSNTASFGAGMYWYSINSDVTIRDCNIADNQADHGGGLFWSGGEPLIQNCNISNNSAEGRYISPPDGSSPEGNLYGGGGGLLSWVSDAIIENCQITGNTSSGTGGGVYLGGGSSWPVLKNCLITNNSAVLNGGGVVSYWYAMPTISNCTIVNNIGVFDPGNPNHGLGGGLSCSYGSETNLINSILWGNMAATGSQLAVLGYDDYTPKPSILNVSFSDVQGSWQDVLVEALCTLNWGTGNINEDPRFVTGLLGSYYLSQSDAGQLVTSSCVDAGSMSAKASGLYQYTTRTDDEPDIDTVDMGYHYRTPLRIPGDFDNDGDIDIEDLAILLSYWLEQNCELYNNCDGADLDGDGDVDFVDYTLFSILYSPESVAGDITAPKPNPMTWEILPNAISSSIVTMKATTATDESGVEYYFECTDGDCNDSEWQDSSTYTDTDLADDSEYTYRVKARDKSPSKNETDWSDEETATTPPFGQDMFPPEPNPSTWQTDPYEKSLFLISMTATTAIDESTPVQYYFECTEGSGNDSGWQTSPTYENTVSVDESTYCYTVTTKDAFNNVGIASIIRCVWIDHTAPQPDPITWQIPPEATSTVSISMTATSATDKSGVEYYFECTDGGGHNSIWQDSPTYIDNNLTASTEYTYRVKTRDKSVNNNEGDWSTEESATTFADANAPQPDPAEWLIGGEPNAVPGQYKISMTAKTATDVSGVQYYFECTAGGGNNSIWQDSPTYTDTGLSADVIYTYRVKTRDKSPSQNETGWSVEKSAMIDFTPPTPDPAEWLVEPYDYYDSGSGKYYHRMEAKKATDINGLDPNEGIIDPNRVQYYFYCLNATDSGWQDSPVYEPLVSGPGLRYAYKVKTRDKSTNHNETAYSEWALAEP